MTKSLGHFPSQSETGSLAEQLPSERLQELIESLKPKGMTPQSAELALYRERPSEVGKKRLLAMGIDPDAEA